MKKLLFLSAMFSMILISSCESDDNDVVDDIIEEDIYPVAELLPKLSDLILFEGDLADLQPIETVEIYKLNTPLFTDYAQKLRFLSIPEGQTMAYNGDGFPIFPDNTILAKTFYYFDDNRNPSLGKTLIETRVLIKKSGQWNVGNYVWNTEQNEAFLDDEEHILPIEWIDEFGESKEVDYVIPSNLDCFTCHQNNGVNLPIGPKVRNLNFDNVGVNQLQKFIDIGWLTGAPAVSEITKLPDWEDDITYNLDERARAYFEVNCAHCHQPGGNYDINFDATFELRYETSFEDSHIYDKRNSILARMSTKIDGYSMPFIGTSLIHGEVVILMEEYVASLDD